MLLAADYGCTEQAVEESVLKPVMRVSVMGWAGAQHMESVGDSINWALALVLRSVPLEQITSPGTPFSLSRKGGRG